MDGDCDFSSNCVSSLNYPSNFGADQNCVVTFTEDVETSVYSPFDLGGHYIMVGKTKMYTGDALPQFVYGASDMPATIADGEALTWITSGSSNGSGWKICFDTPQPSMSPTYVDFSGNTSVNGVKNSNTSH